MGGGQPRSPAMVTPPSATIICPVTNEPASEARKTAMPPMLMLVARPTSVSRVQVGPTLSLVKKFVDFQTPPPVEPT